MCPFESGLGHQHFAPGEDQTAGSARRTAMQEKGNREVPYLVQERSPSDRLAEL